MKMRTAGKLSTILTGLGIIFLILPAFDMFPRNGAFLFASVICFVGAFTIAQLARNKERDRWRK